MSALYYNSMATKIAIVVEGEGYFEMACPHVSSKSSDQQSQDSRSSGQKKSGPSYQKISSRLRPDTVFIVPAGHPFVTVASRNKNLEILCFEVNIKNNIRYPLAGKQIHYPFLLTVYFVFSRVWYLSSYDFFWIFLQGRAILCSNSRRKPRNWHLRPRKKR